MAKPEDVPPDNITFNQFSGIKNTVTRERLQAGELEVAKNVDLDDIGQLHRRRGYTRVATGAYHSLFRDDHGNVYGVKDGVLGKINPDFSHVAIASNVGNSPIAFVHVGENIYFSSDITSGKFSHKTLIPSPWGYLAADKMWLSPVVNPVVGLPPVAGELLMRPPLATALTYYNGRIYMAVKNAVWATELYLYEWVNSVKNYMPYEAEVTALATVTDGIYVGTETGLWFQTGAFGEMRRIAAQASGVIPGSVVNVPPHLIPEQYANATKSAVMLLTQQGVVLALDGGNAVNLTQTKVVLPDVLRANSLFRSQDGANHYVCVADSGGTPASNARIGDYVDAEIRRFQGA